MAKDPAALFYISNWLTSTAEMDSDCRGWYLNLILHQYDKGSLPNDIERLAVLAGVKFSEYTRFEQVFKSVLNKKFEQGDDGRLRNDYANEIIKARELFKEKREDAGKKSYLMRFFKKFYPEKAEDLELYEFISKNIPIDIDTKNEQVLEQVFKQMFELYINRNINKDTSSVFEEGVQGESFEVVDFEFYPFDEFWNDYEKKVGEKGKLEKKWSKVSIEDRKAIKEYIPKYKKAQPEKKFRKNPETFLNNKSWHDEIIPTTAIQVTRQQRGVSMSDTQAIFNELTGKK